MTTNRNNSLKAKHYTYSAFGLQISSELELPGLLHHDGKTDVSISFGEVPEQIGGKLKGSGVLYQASSEGLLLKIPDVANFLIRNGSEIRIKKCIGVTDEVLRLYTVNTPIGIILYQRGNLPLHASAIEVNNKCVVFTGESGAGKSTLLAAFHKKGYRVLTEEICSISLTEIGAPIAHPGAAYTFLWNDVIKHLGKDISKLKQRPNNPNKYKIEIDKGFCDKSLKMERIYILGTKNTAGIEMKEIKGSNKILPLKNNSYRKRIGDAIANPALSFMMHSNIGKHTTVKRISRPKDKLYIDEMFELIVNDIKNDE